MAEIVDGGGGGGGKHGKKTAKKGSARIDMTPMVDLAFLLLTFFVLAATLSKPKAMEIIYPKEAKNPDENTKLNKDLATTILLGEKENEVYYYKGFFKPDSTVLELTNFSKEGIRKMLLDRNRSIIEAVNALKVRFNNKEISKEEYQELRGEVTGADEAPFVIVKTIPTTKYKNVINAVDELEICNVRKRAIQDMAESEAIAVRQRSAELGL
jgi:biopolymer transport protein ExbD